MAPKAKAAPKVKAAGGKAKAKASTKKRSAPQEDAEEIDENEGEATAQNMGQPNNNTSKQHHTIFVIYSNKGDSCGEGRHFSHVGCPEV